MTTESRKMEVSHTLRPATRHRSILLGHGDLLLSAVLLDETCSGFIIGGFFLSCALLFLFFSFSAHPFLLGRLPDPCESVTSSPLRPQDVVWRFSPLYEDDVARAPTLAEARCCCLCGAA